MHQISYAEPITLLHQRSNQESKINNKVTCIAVLTFLVLCSLSFTTNHKRFLAVQTHHTTKYRPEVFRSTTSEISTAHRPQSKDIKLSERREDTTKSPNQQLTVSNSSSTISTRKREEQKEKKKNRRHKYPFEGPTNVPNNNSTAPWAAMCLVAGNEDAYINEWADYHLGLGFGHIYIFDIGPNHTLKAFGQTKKGVQVIHEYHLKENWVQQCLYNRCVNSLRSMARPPGWVMFLDGDEFLVFRNQTQYANVNAFLNIYLPEGALQLNWLVFGTANHTKYSPEPVTKRFQYRRAIPDTNSKTVVVLDHIKSMSVHYTNLKDSFRRVGMGGRYQRKVGLGGSLSHVPKGDVSEAAIYHFMYKSEEDFYNKRCVRGNINEPPIWCGEKTEVGEVFDDTAWQTLIRNVPRYASNFTIGA